MVRTSLNTAVRLIALFVLLWVAVYILIVSMSEDINGLKQKLSSISLGNLLTPVALSLVSYLFRFIRWRLIIRRLGHNLSVTSDFIYYLSGFALTMTPGKTGETIRSAFLLQAAVPVQTSLSAFVIERSFDLLVVGFLGMLLFFSPALVLISFLLMLVIISLTVVWFAGWQGSQYKSNLPTFVLRLLSLFAHVAGALNPKSVAGYAFLGCVAWSAQGLGFFCIVSLFSQDMDVLKSISTYCAGLLVGAASLIPGGIGVTEASLSWLLQTQGLDQNSAILSALISRGCTLWLAVALGCCALVAIIKGNAASGKIN